LQVKLCDPCLSALEALYVMRYINRRILYYYFAWHRLGRCRVFYSLLFIELRDFVSVVIYVVLRSMLCRCWAFSTFHTTH